MISNDSPQLIIQNNLERKRIHLSDQTTWTFGRSQVNSIQLKDQSASRHHAKLESVQGRHFYFVDLNSRNGSLINGQRVSKAVLLKHGDRITIGNTVMVFHQGKVTLPGIPESALSQQVLMVQFSTMQGKIWQEILLSQGILVNWGTPGADLKQSLALQAMSHQLPGTLLIDMRACLESPFTLCQDISQKYPGLKIFLLDNLREDIVGQDYQKAVQQGCLALFPAFRKRKLLQDMDEITTRLQMVLQAIDGRSLQVERLRFALTKLEDLFRKMATFAPLNASPSMNVSAMAANFSESLEEEEDVTSLNINV